jgi:hypothetical protein
LAFGQGVRCARPRPTHLRGTRADPPSDAAADREGPTGTWAERATQLGRHLGPETDWWELTGTTFAGAVRDGWTPYEGSLSESEVERLVSLLIQHTSTQHDCWFGLWSGFGILHPGSSFFLVGGSFGQRWATRIARCKERSAARRERRAGARLATFDLLGQSGRSYLLLRGSVAAAQRFRFGEGAWYQSPTLWWPDDRSWFVHTEIDASSTYLGGSRALIDRIVGEQVLESFEVREDSRAAL